MMDEMRSAMSMSDKQMPIWEMIAKKWASDNNAELIYVNHESFGVKIRGEFMRISVEGLEKMLHH